MNGFHAPANVKVDTEHLPSTYGLVRARPNIPAGLAEVKLPATLPDPAEMSIAMMLRTMMERIPGQRPATPRRPTTSVEELSPTHDQAYQALAWAVQKCPKLAKAKDKDVYAWLVARGDCRFRLPPTEITFTRYVTAARHYHGTLKRKLPRRRP